MRVFPKIDREKGIELTRKLIEVLDTEKGIADNALTNAAGLGTLEGKRLDL